MVNFTIGFHLHEGADWDFSDDELCYQHLGDTNPETTQNVICRSGAPTHARLVYIRLDPNGVGERRELYLCEMEVFGYGEYYRQVSNIRRIDYQNLNVSRLGLQLSWCNILKPGVKPRMKMQLEQCRQALLKLHLSDQQFNI